MRATLRSFAVCGYARMQRTASRRSARLWIWVASRNWSPRMTFLLKKKYKFVTFHYFSAANQNFYKISVPTCSSHHCGPKMPSNLYILASWKLFFLAVKLNRSESTWQILSESMYKMYIEIIRVKSVRSHSTSSRQKYIFQPPKYISSMAFLDRIDERST